MTVPPATNEVHGISRAELAIDRSPVRGVSPADPRNCRWVTSLFVFCTLLAPTLAEAQYVQRFNTVTNGAVTFTGNTLGLDAETDQNGQGTRGAIGTFITTDT